MANISFKLVFSVFFFRIHCFSQLQSRTRVLANTAQYIVIRLLQADLFDLAATI